MFSLHFMQPLLFVNVVKMEKYNINYKGREYPVVDVVLFAGTAEEMSTRVATTELEDELIDDMKNCIGADEAIRLDETICYYIEPREMELPYNDIVKLVEASYE